MKILKYLGFGWLSQGESKLKDPFKELNAIRQDMDDILTSPSRTLNTRQSAEEQLSRYLDENADFIVDVYNRASAIDKQRALKAFMNCFPAKPFPDHLSHTLWGNATARGNLNSALRYLPDSNLKLKTSAYGYATSFISHEILKEHKEELSPLIAQGHFPPFMFIMPLGACTSEEAVEILKDFEAPIAEFFALESTQQNPDPTVDSAFIQFAFQKFEQAGEDVPSLFASIRREIRDIAVTNIFNVAAELPLNARDIVRDNVNVLRLIQQDGDEILSIDDEATGVRLMSVQNTSGGEDGLLILCRKNADQSLTPVFMDRSLFAMVCALQVQSAAFNHPIKGLTPAKLDDMGRELGYNS